MKISKELMTIRELSENYRDNNDGGVYGYDDGNHKLTIRPAFQREFVYNVEMSCKYYQEKPLSNIR